MLAYVLALTIGLGSFAFYMAAFFFPEVHRKSDFYLSGGGLFYALVLWVCAGRITGWVLLSQIASVSLLCWLGWQTLTLRRMLTSPEQQTPIPSKDQLAPNLPGVLQPVTNFLGNVLGKTKPAIPTPKAPEGKSQNTTTAQKPQELQETNSVEVPTQEEETISEPSPEAVAEVTEEPEVPAQEEENILEPSSETLMEAPELPRAAATSQEEPEQNISLTKKQGLVQKVTGFFKGLLGKSKPAAPIPLDKQEEKRKQRSTGRDNNAAPSSIAPIEDDTQISETAESIATESSDADISETIEEIAAESSDVDISETTEEIAAESSDVDILETTKEIVDESSDVDILETTEEIADESSDVDILETTEEIVDESSDAEISETIEEIAAESSDADISETTEEIAVESSDADSSESVELIPPKPPLPELLEEQEKSASSDVTESQKKKKAKIEEIAPEVELAPPAEPMGDGDPQVRKLGR